MPSRSQRDFASLEPAGRQPSGRKPGGKRPRSQGKGGGTRTRSYRLLRWGLILTLLGTACAIVGYWGLIFYFEHRLPDVFEIKDYIERTSQVNRVYGASGEVLAETGLERRSVVPRDQIPKLIKLAVLSAEDADFYEHDGLDYFGMARAMYKNLRDHRFSQGASTITQQVAKTFFFTAEKTISRKLKEVVMARRLENELSKDEILYLYLNQIYWGHGRYGIKEAARFYFGKNLKALTLADAALLAGMIAAPERYSPFKNKDLATERRAFVLDQMAQQGFVDEARARDAKNQPIRLNFRGYPRLGLGAYANGMVQRFLRRHFGAERVRRGGLRVYTSLDARLQEEAERAVRAGLREVDRTYRLVEPLEHLASARIPGYVAKLRRHLPAAGVRSGAIVLGVVTAVDRRAASYTVNVGLGPARLPFAAAERYAGGRDPGTVYRVGDVLRVSPRLRLSDPWTAGAAKPVLNLDQGPQGALVAIDPKTRHIKALVGGYDHATHAFNRASSAKRQAGSTIKPIMFAAALESGIITPLTLLRNVPEAYKMRAGKFWKPRNFSGTYDGRKYTARLALAKSINVIAVKVLEMTGLKRAIDFAKRVGITSKLDRNLSIALGSTALSPLEITNTYATFASGGWAQEPVLVVRVEDWDGTVLFDAEPVRKRATTAKVAYRITEMLEATITHGTAKKLRFLGRPAAGKTGTTDKGMDAWFVGYTANLVAGVWVGFDDRRPIRKGTGGKLAAPIWARFMTAAHEGVPVADFKPPPGLRPLPPPGGVPVARAVVPERGVRSERAGSRRHRAADDMELLYQ